MDNSLPPFNVGDEVEAIKDHSKGCFKKGDRFSITGTGACEKCKGKLVTVGIMSNPEAVSVCNTCQNRTINAESWTNEYRFSVKMFRRISPYQNSVSRSLAEQALKDTGDSRQDIKPERKEVLQ